MLDKFSGRYVSIEINVYAVRIRYPEGFMGEYLNQLFNGGAVMITNRRLNI